MYTFFWNDEGFLRHAGRGPVDFKLTRGTEFKVTVEVTYSSNSALRRGYEKQLPIYSRAERATSSIYLIVRTSDSVAAVEAVQRLRSDALARGEIAPEVIVVDGRRQPSGSRA